MNAVLEKTEPSWKEKVKFLADRMAAIPQVDLPLKHYFAPHVYIREIFMPAGAIVIGKIHKTEHFNIIQKGCVTLHNEDGTKEMLRGPLTFVSKPGVQKVLYIHEDTIWSTIHMTENRDMESLEAEIIEADDYPRFNRALECIEILKAAKDENETHPQEI